MFNRKDAFLQHYKAKHSTNCSFLNSHVIDKDSTDNQLEQDRILFCENVSEEYETPIEDYNTNCSKETKTLNFLLSKFGSILNVSINKIISQLYDSIILTKIQIQSILDFLKQFLSNDLFDIIIQSLQLHYKTSEFPSQIGKMFDLLKNPFHHLDTEYKRNNFFIKNKLLVCPTQVKLGRLPARSVKKGLVSLSLKEHSFSYISVKSTLESFLQLPNVLNTILDYQKEIVQLDVLSNIINGSNYKTFFDKNYKNTIALIFYFDDVEISNPLGSHTGTYKLGTVYFSIATILPEYNSTSRLENVFLNMLFYSSDRGTITK